jgi:outer membrane biosynthesis protein TonB
MKQAIWLLGAFLSFSQAEAQATRPEVHHVRWPLLDMVLVPDSAGLWFMVAPNPKTTQWQARTPLVSLSIDPVLALQWVTTARRLTPAEGSRSIPDAAARLTPPLRDKRGPEFAVLGTNTRKPSPDKKFVFLVSDSAANKWKTFVSSAQVDTLLTSIERAAAASRSDTAGWNALAGQDPDTPVSVVIQPRPAFPSRLAEKGRIGRVWMTYIIGADGRPDSESFWPLLSDDPLFTKAAIDALRRSRFRPAHTGGQPVSQRVFQVIEFRQR